MQKCLKLSKNKYILKLFQLAIMLLIVECFDIKKVELISKGSIAILLLKINKKIPKNAKLFNVFWVHSMFQLRNNLEN